MKKAEKISELKIGQRIYVDINNERKSLIIRSIENKFVPYVITSDNSSHSLAEGIYIEKN